MSEEQKKPARKTSPKKVTPAKTRAKAPARAKKGPKVIRNLHAVGVHVRIDNPLREKPYRVALKPRGQFGDCHTIPVELQDSYEYRSNIGVLFEVITEAEVRAIEYPPVGYMQRLDTPVLIREQDTVRDRFENVDKQIQEHPRRPVSAGRVGENVGMNVVNVPGSDAGLHAQLRAGEGVPGAPEGGFKTNAEILASVQPPRVSISRGHRVQ